MNRETTTPSRSPAPDRALARPRLNAVVRYGAAPVAAAMVALVQFLALPDPSIAPFVFFYFGIAVVSWLGGAGPGLLAVAISAAVANWLFVEPHRAFALHRPALTATSLFLVGASAVALLCARFRGALLESRRAAADLERHATLLERSEAALRRSEARYRTLFDSMDAGFTVIEVLHDEAGQATDYRYLEVNRAFEGQTGLSDVVGRRVRELVPSHERHWFEIYGRVVRTGEPIRFEQRAEALGRWFDVYAFPIDEPRHRRVAVLFTDVTERRRTAEELRRADRSKTEFLAVLSHELRNPLAPIRNSVHLLSRVAPGSDQAQRALAVIDRQSQQLTRLVDDLLDVTRIERAKIQLHLERLDLGALAARVADDHRELLETAGVALAADAPEPILVSGDPARLTQVIGNLLQNAAKFTPRGGVATLSVRRVEERFAEVTVRDTGEGVAPEILPRVFEPFVQAENTIHRSSGGLGLGLALVKGLVELHGGTVHAESPGPGLGATFTVRIPVERRAVARGAPEPERPSEIRARRVLLVEDNPDAAETMKELLELDGHRVEVVHSGTDAVAAARACAAEVVLCDIGLPGMDGLQVARAIRSDPGLASVGMVALSGYAQPQDLDASRAAGFDVHLAKPSTLEALERSIVDACAAALDRARSDDGELPPHGPAETA